MDNILAIIEQNARLSLEEIAAMANLSLEEAARRMDIYKKQGIIRGTRALIDWERVGGKGVQAFIDVRVTPKKGHGFDEIAETIAQFPEVENLYLMSGGYDLSVTVSGDGFHEVANFVSRRLAVLDDVLSTTTHFVLKTYKKDNALYSFEPADERESVMI